MSDESMITTSSTLFNLKYLLIIIIAVIFVYGQTLNFDFVNYDDDELIYHNEDFLSSWGNLKTAFTAHAFIGAGGECIYYRPLLVVSFITDYHLWQLKPFGYHLTNIVFHTLTALIVFFLMQTLLNNQFTALFSTLIFALHPLQTESVAWIAGRNDVLLGFFIALMMFFYIQSQQNNRREKFFLVLSMLSFSLALFTKESAVFYFLMLPIYILCFQKKTTREIISIKNFIRFWPFASLLLIYLLIRWNIIGSLIGAERLYGKGKLFIDRLINVPAIIAEHLKLLLAPFNLSVAHPLSEIIWLQQPLYVVAVVIVILLLALIWQSWKKNRRICFGILWLTIGLLPALNIVPMPRPILEHRFYVPLIGFAIVAGYGMEKISSHIRQFTYRIVPMVILMVVMLVMSYMRLPVWQNGITLFTDAVKKSPSDLHANYSLARAYYDAELYNEAVPVLKKYLKMAPVDVKGYRFLREVYYVTRQRQEVARLCQMMIALEPRDPKRYLETGVIYEELNHPDTAAAYYHQGIILDSSAAELHFRMGIVQERLGQFAVAEQSYRRAIVSDTPFVDAYPQLAMLYISRNEFQSAAQILETGLKSVKPTEEYLRILNNLYLNSGDLLKSQELHRRFQFSYH